jgi:hypothetical protein
MATVKIEPPLSDFLRPQRKMKGSSVYLNLEGLENASRLVCVLCNLFGNGLFVSFTPNP